MFAGSSAPDVSSISTVNPEIPEVTGVEDKLLSEAAKTIQTVSHQNDDQVSVGMDAIYKSLTILGDEIVKKLNDILKTDLPGGIESLQPEDHTPEKTAQRIVDGATAFFGVFARQNPKLEGEELLSKFMETIRGGIKTGYDQAAGILGDLGAFQFDGVQKGIEETMRLVEDKLKAFEAQVRGADAKTPAETTATPPAATVATPAADSSGVSVVA